ncbi:MAG: type II toxin-antitoxin system VapB family antitoxin [Verrucomicrobia bacterium]|nr:type II toxin-antitoxin system VapB family antitoxin [Verrucomicrobiota bacterium]OQW94614.1 MAG: hypothetical protein BWK77_08920 [Verrucomicrobia bacterium A1]
MRTNIELDDSLLATAREYSVGRSKRAIVEEALTAYVTMKAEERRRATYRERLARVRVRLAGVRTGVDVRDMIREDRDSR